jgi:hypothetical protein
MRNLTLGTMTAMDTANATRPEDEDNFATDEDFSAPDIQRI